MAAGKFHHAHELFKIGQEDAWERTSRLCRDVANYGLLLWGSFNGPSLKESELKDADQCNDWLRVPGNEMPDDERRRIEDEIIAGRENGG